MAHIRKTTRKDGKTAYVVRYRDPGGKERSKSFTRRKDADSFMHSTEVKKNIGDWIAPERQRITLRNLVEQDAESADTANTKALKTATARNLGDLGDMPIGKIESADIETWLIQLRDGRPWADGKPLAASSISIYLRNVKTALNRAVKSRPPMLAKSPAEHVKPPKQDDHEITSDQLMSVETVERILDAAGHTTNRRGERISSASPLATMILLHVSTGLRPGELCGLRRENIDLDAGELHVREQAGRKGTPWSWEPLKTRASRRSVPIPERALVAIRDHMKRSPDAAPTDPLFITRQGGQYTSTTYGGAFTDARDRALGEGNADWTAHDCRHFYASMLIAHHVDLATVQANLGHGSPAETLRTYTHLWPDNRDQTRQAVNAVL